MSIIPALKAANAGPDLSIVRDDCPFRVVVFNELPFFLTYIVNDKIHKTSIFIYGASFQRSRDMR